MASGLSGLRKVPCSCSGDVETQPGEDSITQQGVPRVGSHSPRGHGRRTHRALVLRRESTPQWDEEGVRAGAGGRV